MVVFGRKWLRVGLEVIDNKVGLGFYYFNLLMVIKIRFWILLKIFLFFYRNGRSFIV